MTFQVKDLIMIMKLTSIDLKVWMVFLLFPISLQAQLVTTTTVFNDVECQIYPVRIPQSYTFVKYALGDILDYESIPRGEENLPFNPFNLTDGKYLAYYPKRQRKWEKYTEKPIFSDEDTTLVAVVFTLKDNRKEGEAIWYELGKNEIIQIGHFRNGIKHGKWKLTRERATVEYSYENGLLEGDWQSYHKKQLVETKQYAAGLMHGTHIEYNSKGEISSKSIFSRGTLDTRVKYNKKGRVQTVIDNTSQDTIQKDFYANGELSEAWIRTNDSNVMEEVSFYSNGNLESKAFVRVGAWFFWSVVPDSIQDYFHLNKIIGNDMGTLSIERFHPNGAKEYSYSLELIRQNEVVKVLDDEGSVIREVVVEPMLSDTQNVWIKDISYAKFNKETYWGRKKKYQRIETYTISAATPIATYVTDKNGNTSVLRSSFYLHHRYLDSSGIALMSVTNTRKKRTENYSVLHTQQEVERKLFKGRVYQDFKVIPYGEAGAKKVHLTISETDKNQIFRVDHMVDISELGDQIYASSDGKDVHVQTIQTTMDTLDYTIFYKGSPFTGKLVVDSKYRRPFYGRAFYRRLFYTYMVKYDRSRSKWSDTHLRVKLYTTNWGSQSGTSKVYDGEVNNIKSKWGNLSVEYEDNMKQGEEINGSGSISAYYINGQKHGLNREKGGSGTYYFGKLHGDFVNYRLYTENEYLGYQLSLQTNYHLDTLHGWFTKYAAPHLIKERVYIDKGYPHGKYWLGNITAPLRTEANFHYGYLVDTAKFYFAEGVLKTACIFQLKDSNFYRGEHVEETGFRRNAYENGMLREYESTGSNRLIGNINMYVGSDNIVDNFVLNFDANRTGDYIYYYKNGVMSMRGRVEDGYRVGVWEFWDLNGGKMKRIAYEDGRYLVPNTNDTIDYSATIEMWHPNGKPLLSGVVISLFTQFKCDQELAVNFENIHYLSMYDTDGREIMKNNSGEVKEYHNNGLLRLEGRIEKGKRSGLWSFYDPDGRLEEVGRYKDGKKDGQWLKGDLEAVPHYYDRCVIGELSPKTLPDIEEQQVVTTRINILETMYDNGVANYRNSIQLLPLYGVYKPDPYSRLREHDYDDILFDY